jgi:carbohydrate kinase (thermoresistant glucokinase family)
MRVIRFIVVMGVSGSGKTSVGKVLAEHSKWDFYDADDFHPPENVAKMASGIPLDDSDRAPWLAALHHLATDGTSFKATLDQLVVVRIHCPGTKDRQKPSAHTRCWVQKEPFDAEGSFYCFVIF